MDFASLHAAKRWFLVPGLMPGGHGNLALWIERDRVDWRPVSKHDQRALTAPKHMTCGAVPAHAADVAVPGLRCTSGRNVPPGC